MSRSAATATPAAAAIPATAQSGLSAAAGFPIVGIGASAGGLAALDAFFAAIPTDRSPGIAFVLVQHLAPDHESLLCQLIQRRTPLRVSEVVDGVVVEPNCVYIIPPSHDMALRAGHLKLFDFPEPRGRRAPIDFFFSSLAQERGDRAIAIILSGTGSDGTLGVHAIKAAGGMVMVQEPESAEQDGMPRSAIATGLVDYVLPPDAMPRRLLDFPERAHGTASPANPLSSDDALDRIFALLRLRTSHDFSLYKKPTILRRIERRMAARQLTSHEAYAESLQADPAEVTALFRDLLIGVTAFFRDPEAFKSLEAHLPRLLRSKHDGTTLRVWVPGCSTGEEAYSLAILLMEQLELVKTDIKLQIFATDIDAAAIAHCRTGLYPAGALAEMAPHRLAKFFTHEPDGSRYRAKKVLRDLLIFSEQDVIKDPPFSRLDLISCRNLLIYLGAELQNRLMPLFHYALNSGGLLLLGTSESVGGHVDCFTLLEPKSKLYLRRDDVPAVLRRGAGLLFPSMSHFRTVDLPPDKAPRMRKYPLRELTERALLQHHSPTAALVDANGEILYLHGRAGRYLEPASGESSLNIVKMARDGLMHELRAALLEIAKTRKTISRPQLRVRTNGSFSAVDLTVRWVVATPDAPEPQGFVLVVFEERPVPPQLAMPSVADGAASALPVEPPRGTAQEHVAELRRELEMQTASLRTMKEDLEASNEELRAANEELQSVNEELQSTNEEMETSKEELQAVNEELATVNAELQARVAELSRSNNDMNNLMAGTGVGTLFVDHDLRIQRFTPAVTAVISLIPSDIGRPVGQIAGNFIGYDSLVADTRGVLDTLVPKEVEVQSATAWYLLRIRPYRTLSNVIEGAVITFTEITELKTSQAALRRLAVVVRDSRAAILVHDLAGQILAWNPAAERLYGWTEAEALDKNIRDLVPEADRAEATTAIERLRRAEVLPPASVQRLTKAGKTLTVNQTATALIDATGTICAVSMTERVNHDDEPSADRR